eukprot:gene23774-28389_t
METQRPGTPDRARATDQDALKGRANIYVLSNHWQRFPYPILQWAHSFASSHSTRPTCSAGPQTKR